MMRPGELSMGTLSNRIKELLVGNKAITRHFRDIVIAGDDPWNLTISANCPQLGSIRINSFVLSDFWAVLYWWIHTLSYDNRRFHPLFPCDERASRYLANHFKNQESHRDMIFNAWLVREETLGFENEIIGHFYIINWDSEKPSLGLGVSDKHQGRKLGTLFIHIAAYLLKAISKEYIWLTTDLDNEKGYALYQKIGFEDFGRTEVYIPADGYKRIEREMRMNLENFE